MAKGDHIYVECFLHDHHGIDCGDGTVIHYSVKLGNGRITRVSKSQFANGQTIKLKKYTSKYSPDVIVKRAEKRLGERKYHVLLNNCEHLAYDCTSGEPDSWQVYQAGAAVVTGGAIAAAVPVTSTISAGGILGFLGATTTAVALGPTIAVGGALAGLGYLAFSTFSKLDDSKH
jgi:hypothetical protein